MNLTSVHITYVSKVSHDAGVPDGTLRGWLKDKLCSSVGLLEAGEDR